MPTPVLTGNFDVHPREAYNSLKAALVELGCVDNTGESSAVRCVDYGEPTGDMQENGVLCHCSARHGLWPGDRIRLVSTGLYDGEVEIEPEDEFSFYTLNVPYVGDSESGRWEPIA